MNRAAFPFDASHVAAFHDACLDFGKWPDEEAPAHPPGEIWPWVEANHAGNARSRHELDEAHVPLERMDATRRESIARLDEAIHGALASRMPQSAPSLPESPGVMIDRLSVIAIRVRAAALDGRGAAQLEAQRRDLLQHLSDALAQCAAGRARFDFVH
jgi:hypothetical protein